MPTSWCCPPGPPHWPTTNLQGRTMPTSWVQATGLSQHTVEKLPKATYLLSQAAAASSSMVQTPVRLHLGSPPMQAYTNDSPSKTATEAPTATSALAGLAEEAEVEAPPNHYSKPAGTATASDREGEAEDDGGARRLAMKWSIASR